MRKNIKSILAKTLAVTLVVSMAGVSAPNADAAKKPALSTKKVTVTAGKSKKVKIKNVKAKKVKKLTVSTNKKKIVTVKKNGKTAFTIKGIKAGSAKVTAKVKVGKKTTKLTVNVKVKKAAKVTVTPAPTTAPTATPTAAITQAPATAPAATPTVDPKPTKRPGLADTNQEARPSGEPLIEKTFDFENGSDDWFARCADDQVCKLETSDETRPGSTGKKSMRIFRDKGEDGLYHAWNGAGYDLSAVGTLGATYTADFWAKISSDESEDLDGDEVKMRFSGARKVTSDAEEVYENYPADTDYMLSADEWRHFTISFVAPATFYSYMIYFETNGGGKYDIVVDDFTLTRTSAPAGPDLTLASIKDTYAPYIGTMGTALTYSDLLNENTLNFVKHHFNSITLGNEMKADAMISNSETLLASESGYILPANYGDYAENKDKDGNVIVPKLTMDVVDKVLKICKENGIKVRVHMPMWHQQMPKAFFCEGFNPDGKLVTDKNVILAREEMFIRTAYQYYLTSQYADVIYAFDVVNEYTHMSNEGGQVGSENWWKYSFGKEMKTDCEYVKKAFVWAYDVLQLCDRTDISLIYNDYNTYDPKTTAQIIELINNINKVDDVNKVGKICAGIGMQSHLNDELGSVDNYKEAIEKFAAQGYEIQITELDITNNGKIDSTTTEEEKQTIYEAGAKAYGQIMNAILEEKAKGANITAVVIWGMTDSTSWRSDRSPLLFGTDIADKKPAFDAVIDAAKNFKASK